MKSPITNRNNSKKIGEIAGSFLCNQYNVKLNIDIERLIPKNKNIDIYKCLESNVVFYKGDFKFGDSQFYADLEKIEWYYSDWKWDYEMAFQLIKENEKVLDVGCGFGYFLEKLKNEKNCTVEGIEFNESAYRINLEKGIKISNSPIEEFAKNNVEKFDVICSFQVLEHIEYPIPFLEAKLQCLKKGGKMIVAVPNNDSFIKYSDDNVMNMPPHHTLLWNKKSLNYLPKIVPIKKVNVFYEPANFNHPWHQEVVETLINRNRFYSFLDHKAPLFTNFMRRFIRHRLKEGHSIMVVYEKL